MCPSFSRSNENSCCFWIQKSNLSTKAKIGTTLIVAALAAITLVTSLLLVLAHHGIPLGCFNSLAQVVNIQWLYAGIGLSLITLIIDVIYFVSLLRQARNRPFSDSELKNYNLMERVEKEHIFDKMLPKTYWLVTEKSKNQAPNLYAILIKDEKGRISTEGYLTEKGRKTHIQKLGKGYHNSLEVYKNAEEHPLNYVRALLGQERSAALEQKGLSLPNGFYLYQEVILDSHEVLCAFIVSQDGRKYTHFVKKGQESTFISKHYPGMRDGDAASQRIKETFQSQAKFCLTDKQYWTFECGQETPPLFALAYKPLNEEIHYAYFATKKERDHFLATHCQVAQGWVDAKNALKNCKTYTESEVLALVIQDLPELGQLLDFEYYSQDINTAQRPLYALAWGAGGKKIERAYFKTAIDGESHILSLKNYVDRQDIQKQLSDIINKENLLIRCTANEYFLCSLNVRGTPLYFLLFKLSGEITGQYWRSFEELSEATKTGKFSAKNGFTHLLSEIVIES